MNRLPMSRPTGPVLRNATSMGLLCPMPVVIAFPMSFHPDRCDRDDTGIIGTVSGMKAPENGRVGRVAGEREVVAIVSKCSKLSGE